MKLIFENAQGKIEMSGGGNGIWRLCKINGTGMPLCERQLLCSYDFDGARQNAKRLIPRNIAISGDVKGDGDTASELMRILCEACTLTICGDKKSRAATVNAAEASFEKKGGGYMKFVLSLTCDDPYFYDTNETVCGLYVRRKLIDDKTVLPAVFSARENEAQIEISGDRAVEPIIELSCTDRGSGDGYIVIENLTTCKKFRLDYIPQKDERITIDVGKCTIVSDISGNIIRYLSDDSFMSDLVLDCGRMHIRTVGYGAAGRLSAYLRYKNKYIEAFI